MPEVMYRVAREFDVVTVRVPEEVQREVDRLVAENRCLGCEKEFEADEKRSCGQCPTCFSASYRAINRGDVTRNQLIREGKLLKSGKPGPKPKNDYTRRLSGR